MTFCAKRQRLAQIGIQWEGICFTKAAGHKYQILEVQRRESLTERQFYVVGQELQRLEAIITSYMQHLLNDNLNWSHKSMEVFS
jgi:hypothetical protein